MREKIGKITLDDTCYSGSDLYSDGPVEEELLEIAKSCHTPEEYNQVIAERKSWPVMYHFSHIRGNIVSWLPITKEDKVLEIGAGCGAITGALAKKAGSVTCVELSRQRSLVNAYRNEDCDNVTILLGAFEEVEKTLAEKYDYITFIGVFEYAACYTDNENPFSYMLQLVERHLAPGGKIIIAIENRLGLKYWAGCAEDHVGRFFEGLEGYPNTKDVHTFSRTELIRLFHEAGNFPSPSTRTLTFREKGTSKKISATTTRDGFCFSMSQRSSIPSSTTGCFRSFPIPFWCCWERRSHEEDYLFQIFQ